MNMFCSELSQTICMFCIIPTPIFLSPSKCKKRKYDLTLPLGFGGAGDLQAQLESTGCVKAVFDYVHKEKGCTNQVRYAGHEMLT